MISQIQAKYYAHLLMQQSVGDGIYIDPPYNTDASEILYKNNYKHSSFLTMMENRVLASCKIIKATKYSGKEKDVNLLVFP